MPPLQSIPSIVLSRPKGGSADPYAADAPQTAILQREAGEISAEHHFFIAAQGGSRQRRARRGQRREEVTFFRVSFFLTPSSKTQFTTVANPSPLGLFAFALTALLMTGANTALTEDGATQHRVACYGLMYGGLAQIMAAVYEMKRGSTFGATTFYTYGGYWVGLSLLTLLHDGGAGGVEGAQAAPHVDQMVLVLYGVLTVIFFGATLRMNRALQAVFFGLAVLHFLLAIGLTYPVARHVAGWWGIGVSLTATYTGVAELYNEVYGRVLIPLGEMRTEPAAAKPPAAEISDEMGRECVV